MLGVRAPWAASPWRAREVEFVSGPVKLEGSSVHPPSDGLALQRPSRRSGHCWPVSQLIAAALAVCPTALSAVKTRPWT